MRGGGGMRSLDVMYLVPAWGRCWSPAAAGESRTPGPRCCHPRCFRQLPHSFPAQPLPERRRQLVPGMPAGSSSLRPDKRHTDTRTLCGQDHDSEIACFISCDPLLKYSFVELCAVIFTGHQCSRLHGKLSYLVGLLQGSGGGVFRPPPPLIPSLTSSSLIHLPTLRSDGIDFITLGGSSTCFLQC